MSNSNNKLRILIVDENETTRMLCRELVQHYHVVQVGSRKALTTHLLTFPEYDVILVEYELPEKRDGTPKPIGLTILKQLRTRYPHAQLRLFFNNDETVLQMEEDSMIAWIEKSQKTKAVMGEISLAGVQALQMRSAHSEKIAGRVNTIAKTLIKGFEESIILQTIVRGVAELGFDRVRLFGIDEAGDGYLKAQYGHKEAGALEDQPWSDLQFDLQNPQPCLVNQPDSVTKEHFKSKAKSGITAQRLELPLVVDGQLVGVISADASISGRQILTNEFAPLMGVAVQAAIAFNKIQLRDKERRHNLLRKTLVQVALKIGQLKTVDEVYQAISKAIVEFFPSADHSGLVIFAPDKRSGKVVAEYPETDELIGTTIPVEDNTSSYLTVIENSQK